MDTLESFEDRGLIRIMRTVDAPATEIGAAIARHWALLDDEWANAQVSGTVGGVRYRLDALQDYVEGPVLQLTGPDTGMSSATFLLFMHPMDTPRPDGAFAGQVVDSGLHYHFGPRALTIYVAQGALVAIPCLSPPAYVNLRRGRDYELREVVFAHNGVSRNGFEVLLLGPQIVEVEFGALIAHSFNAVGARCLVISRHPDEALEFSEAQKRSGFAEIGDGSMFLLPPRQLAPADLQDYADLIARQ